MNKELDSSDAHSSSLVSKLVFSGCEKQHKYSRFRYFKPPGTKPKTRDTPGSTCQGCI